jgi:predicted N-acetyltransferase YhbS
MSQPLPDGLALRAAQPADKDQIATLLAARGDPPDAVDHRLVVEDPDAGWQCCAVVVDGDRVVSTATLLDETLVLDGVVIPAGQVELVATDPAYEGRGLVRALMGWAHERSARRGHLVQVMIGIPYFYRQFGYQYAISLPHTLAVRTVPGAAAGYHGRRAGYDDIPAMARLQDEAQRAYNLRMAHSPACWRWLVGRDGGTQIVVERGGEVVATGRLTEDDDDVVLGEVAAPDPIAAGALLAYADSHAAGRAVHVKERPGSPGGDALAGHLAPAPAEASLYYARVPDVRVLLDHLRPVLSARLATCPAAPARGEVLVSFYRHHVRLTCADGQVTEVRSGGRLQGPASLGGAGVAPDMIGPLLLSPYGIGGLAERHPDVYPGPHDAVMRALFPPVRADLLTFYLP